MQIYIYYIDRLRGKHSIVLSRSRPTLLCYEWTNYTLEQRNNYLGVGREIWSGTLRGSIGRRSGMKVVLFREVRCYESFFKAYI